jgi:hypothetical protein
MRHVKRAPKGHLGSLDFWGPWLSTWSRWCGIVWSSGIEIGSFLYSFHSQVPICHQWCPRMGSFSLIRRELLFGHHYFSSHMYYPLHGYSTCTQWCHKLTNLWLVSMPLHQSTDGKIIYGFSKRYVLILQPLVNHCLCCFMTHSSVRPLLPSLMIAMCSSMYGSISFDSTWHSNALD